jgi:hypothetical protein
VDRKPGSGQPADRNGRGKRRTNGRKGEPVGAGQEIPI